MRLLRFLLPSMTLLARLNPTSGKWWWSLIHWSCPVAVVIMLITALPLIDAFYFELGAGQIIEVERGQRELLIYHLFTIPDKSNMVEIYLFSTVTMLMLGSRITHLAWLLSDGYRQGKQIAFNAIGHWQFI